MLAFVFLAHCAAVVLGAASVVWLLSLLMRDTSIVDVFWGFGFALVGATCLVLAMNGAASNLTPYIVLLCALPILWGLRLTAHLARRNLSVLGGHGEDGRYVAMRKRSGLPEMRWRRRAFFTIYLGQGALILIVSAPVWVAAAIAYRVYRTHGYQTPGIAGGPASYGVDIGVLSLIGTALWLAGVLFEWVGDAQLRAFLRRHADFDGPYESKPVLDTGLWAWTRHPNYFGNALLWWGIFVVACEAFLQSPHGQAWGLLSGVGPVVMTVLLTRVSGRDLLERRLSKRPLYRDYVARTPGFIPRPPARK